MSAISRQSFDAELIQHQPRLRAAALKLCFRQPNAEETALDVLQDTNVRAMERHDQYCGGSLIGWLYAIMGNVFRDRMRKLKTREHEKCFTDLATPDEQGELIEPEYPDVGDPHSKLEAAQTFEAISRLPTRVADVLTQSGVGSTSGEIAASLKLTEANVRKLIERGRLDLRLTLALQPQKGKRAA